MGAGPTRATALLLASGALCGIATADDLTRHEADPYLGRWDLTLHTPTRDYAAWLDIQSDKTGIKARMVGRWGRVRPLPHAQISQGRLRFISPASEEGDAGELTFEGTRSGSELSGTLTTPKGPFGTWRAARAPSLARARLPRPGAPLRLFNGQDTTGWTPGPGPNPWRVVDGALVSQGGGADLISAATFDDFSLHIEFNCSPGANSGIYLRGRYEVQIEDDRPPGAPDERTGAVYGFLAPTPAAPRAPGRWHAYDIQLIGRRITVVLDGTTLIDNQEIPGITGGALDSHESQPGPLMLQGGEKGRVAFRHIVLTPLQAAGQATLPSTRVRGLIAQMSREEKLAVIRGAHEPEQDARGEAGWTRGVPRLSIPDLRFADGPPGVLVHHTSTGMPSTLSMAATFSPEDAEMSAVVIATDARRLGIDVTLQPYINLYRDPTFERAYNTLGEDPVLTGTLAARFVRGAQGEGVMVQAKHFVGYEGGSDIEVDERTLREVYLVPFVSAARAGVASIMCAYNRINGRYACDSDPLLNGVLRAEEGFSGFITSDWGAAHAPEFLLHGMDMEQPGTGPGAVLALGQEPAEKGMSADEVAALLDIQSAGVPEEQRFPVPRKQADAAVPTAGLSRNLGEALAKGSLTDADLDRAVAHVLSTLERFGWLDRRPSHAVRADPLAVEPTAHLVQHLAERGAVLLKNDGILPLRPRDLSSLALIGPGAQQTFAIVTGEEQSYGRADRQIGAWQALRAQGARGITLAVADDMTGMPIPKEAWSGLTRSPLPGGTPIPDPQIDFTRKSGHPLPAGSATQWQGKLQIPREGDYDIALQLLGATGKFWIDDRKVGDMGWWGGHGDIVFPNRDNVVPTTDGLDNVRRRVHLTAGPHSVRVETIADGSADPVQVRLAWVTPVMREKSFTEAVDLARRTRIAVVFAWSRNRPHFGLPGDQDRLIEAIAQVNPNTIVVLNTGQAVALPWLSKVRAVLEMWYTGDEGGWAAANLLTGKANPGGHLPITWPHRLEDLPATDPRFPERASKAGEGRTIYSEGILVGYRWLDRQGIEPLFPFGHGLSYSTFTYSDLRLTRSQDGISVSCKIRNTSDREGDAVVQVYLSGPDPAPAGVDFPIRALAAFDRITLKAGATREVRMQIPAERLRYWSTTQGAWQDATTGRRIYVGASSRDLPLSAKIE